MCNICGIVSDSLMPESAYWKKMCEYIVNTKKDAFQQNGCTAVCTCNFYKYKLADFDCFSFLNGKINNFKRIKHILTLRGIVFETDNYAELILKGFFALGESIFKLCSGEFSGVIWDGYNRELILFRDKIGFETLFYYYDGQRIAFCENISGLLKLPFVRADFCPDIYCRLFTLAGCKLNCETFFENVYEVPASGYIVYKDNILQVKNYYSFSLESQPDTYRQTVKAFEFLMRDFVFYDEQKEKVLTEKEIMHRIEKFILKNCMPSPYLSLKDLCNMEAEEVYTSTLSAFDIPKRFRLPVKNCKEKDREFINDFLSTLPAFSYDSEKDILQKEEMYIKVSIVLPQVVFAKKSACKNLSFPYLEDSVFEYSLKSLKHREKILKNYIKPEKTKAVRENIRNLKTLFYQKAAEEDFMAGFIEKEEVLRFIRLFPRPETMIYLLQVNFWLSKFL